MQPKLRAEARHWRTLAARDLRSSELLIAGGPDQYGNATYHAQQAAEKALKAFLIAHGESLVRTHNLEELVKDAERIDPAFQNQLYAATTLNPFATRYRYPVLSGPDLPDEIDTQEAHACATTVVDFVRERLFPPPAGSETS